MITIITPTYNRVDLIDKAYDSLCKQTSFDFEWIIVDDGSSDNTEFIVKEWIKKERKFDLKYTWQPNGGKHRAINKGVSMASYEYVLILDSDDILVNDAIETIHKWVVTIEKDENFAGVSGLKGKINNGVPIGNYLNSKFIDATNIERIKKGLLGDKAEVYKTDILKKYPFPEFEGENFLRETAVWDRIAKDGYKLRWFNKIIYLCDYLEDGLTRGASLDRYKLNYNGFTYCTKLYIECYPLIYSFLKIGQYYDISNRIGFNDNQVCVSLNIGKVKLVIGKLVWKLNLIRKSIMKGKKHGRI